MPECIVCKGYYSSDKTTCQRCGSDNGIWLRWRKIEPVEQEGLTGLFHFTEPHFHAPFLFIATALAFGLMGIGGLWKGVEMAARLVVVTVTVGGCLVIVQGVYAGRHKLRESELLREWKSTKREKEPRFQLGAQWKTILVPVAAVVLILFVAYALVKFEDLWQLASWLILDKPVPTPTPEATAPPATEGEATPTPVPTKRPSPTIQERVKRTVPLNLLIGYGVFSLALTYFSAMALVQGYTKRLSQALPHPIFLQDDKLAQVVRKEAEVELGRIDPKNPNIIDYSGYVKYEEEADPHIMRLAPNVEVLTAAAGGGPSSPRVEVWGQAATWIWDELERTRDGGIKMKVARQEVYRLPQNSEGKEFKPCARVSYTVRAGPWGRITEIKRVDD